MSLEVANRFPKNERGAQALYWLAARNQDKKYKAKIFELLKNKYAPSQYNWSASGMSSYFNLLLPSQPQKAWDLANEMMLQAKDDRTIKTWSSQKVLAAQMLYAQSLMSAQKSKEAIALLYECE